MNAEKYIIKKRGLSEKGLPFIVSFSREEIIKYMEDYHIFKSENFQCMSCEKDIPKNEQFVYCNKCAGY